MINNNNQIPGPIPEIPEFFMSLDVISNKSAFQSFFIKVILNSLFTTIPVENVKNKFSFKLSRFSQAFIILYGKKFPKLDKTFIRYSPDAVLTIDDHPFCPIEFEIYLNREKQLDQLINYYEIIHTLSSRMAKAKKDNIRYIQLATVISFNLSISPAIKNKFAFHRGEYRPLVVFSIEDDWAALPKKSVAFQAFDLMHSSLDPDDKIKVINEFVKNRSSYENFYYLNLLLIFGDVTLKTKIEADMKLKEIADDLPGAIESVPPMIGPYLKPDVIRTLLPEQLIFLSPEQLKFLTPDQVKSLPREQVEYLTGEQVKHLTGEQLKYLTGEQLKYLTGEQLKYLTGEQLKYLTGEQVKYLTGEQVKHLTGDQLKHLTGDQLKHLTGDQVKHLTGDQLKFLTGDQLKFLTGDQVKYLTPEQLKFLTPDQVKSLPREQLKYLTPEQLKFLTPDQVKSLPREKIKYLTEDQLKKLIKSLEGRVSKSLIDKILKELNSH
ncbi:MAG: hypothetical protein ACTSRA_07080 [Promethearchaeota archaeon]